MPGVRISSPLCLLLGMLCLMASAVHGLSLSVNSSYAQAGTGTTTDPFKSLDSALDAAFASGDWEVTILLQAPGEYPLDQSYYSLRSDGYIYLTIKAGQSAWEGSHGPTIVRGANTPSQVDLIIGGGIDLDVFNIEFGQSKLSGGGTEFMWFMDWESMFQYITFSNVTVKGGLQPNWETNGVTNDDVVRFQIDTEESLYNSLTWRDIKIKPGVIFRPTAHYSSVIVERLDFQGPSILGLRSVTIDTSFTDSIVSGMCEYGYPLFAHLAGGGGAWVDNVVVKDTTTLYPKHWCSALFSKRSLEDSVVKNLHIKNYTGNIFDVPLGKFEVSNTLIEDSTAEYPNAVPVLDIDDKITYRPVNLFDVAKPSTMRATGLTMRNNVGVIRSEGKLSIEKSLIENHSAQSGAGGTTAYFLAAVAASSLNLTDSIISSAGVMESGILQCNGTAVVVLSNVVVQGTSCTSNCLLVNELGDLTIKNSNFSSIKTQGAFLKVERSEAEDTWPLTRISQSKFTDIVNTVIEGSLAPVNISQCTFSNNTGGSVLRPIGGSQFSIQRCAFEDNKTPENGAVLSECKGSIAFDDSTFSRNSAQTSGGAIFCNLDVHGCSIDVWRSNFTSNSADIGGGVYIDKFTETPQLRLVDVLFTNNSARKYGGAVYTGARKYFPVGNSGFINNTAPRVADFGSATCSIKSSSSWGNVNLLAGEVLPSVSLDTYDCYGTFIDHEKETAVVLQASLRNATTGEVVSPANGLLLGSTLMVADSGRLTFNDLTIFGQVGSYNLTISQDNSGQGIQIPPFTIPVSISNCEAPKQLLPSLNVGSRVANQVNQLECRLPRCSQGCAAPAGVCVGDGNCNCVDTSYEGLSCQLKRGQNDSLTFSFSPSSPVFAGSQQTFDFSVAGRDALFAQVQKVYGDSHNVIFRDYWSSEPSTRLQRRSSNGTLNLKFSLINLYDGNFLNYRELQAAGGKLQTSLDPNFTSVGSAGVGVATGALANTSINSIGSILVVVSSAVTIIFTIVLAILLFRKRAHPALVGTSVALDMVLAFGIVNLLAFPITDAFEPTNATCSAQVLMLPNSFGLPATVLLFKAYQIFTRRRNKVALRSPIPLIMHRFGTSCIFISEAIFWTLAVVWRTVQAPTPRLLYTSQSRFWSCSGNGQTPFVGILLALMAMILAFTARFSLKTIKVGWPAPAMEDKILFLNAANMIVTGGLAAGILLPNMMDGSAQFALRVALCFVVGTVLSVTILGYKIWLTMSEDSEDDHVMRSVKKVANVSKLARS
ncbi:hypothetical protein DFS34DRAFT_628680 [Phlyctochytrium arcticum]|nr:hypothetical protein DFS34DRAFT_628680 [Phlyctochytrium arcticum]